MKNNENSSTKSAYLYIINLLSKRDYSKYKLENKLLSKGYEELHINTAIDEAIEKGYLKDKEYAAAKAKNLMLKGIHPFLIEIKLSEEQLNITKDHLEEIFEEYDMSIDKQLEQLLRKKLRSFTPKILENKRDVITQKMLRYCSSKGHESEDILCSLERILEI